MSATATAFCTTALVLAGAEAQVTAQAEQEVCLGDTRGDRRCAHDPTHRVCAKIGNSDTSFWQFTGQSSWCGTAGNYGGAFGSNLRCPPSEPTWCICKWATASWIKGEGCNDNIEIDCAATDVCTTPQGLFFVYDDFNVDLLPARECMQQKCAVEWAACKAANPAGAHGGHGGSGLLLTLGGSALVCVIMLSSCCHASSCCHVSAVNKAQPSSRVARTPAMELGSKEPAGATPGGVTPGVALRESAESSVFFGHPAAGGKLIATGLVAPMRGMGGASTYSLASPLTAHQPSSEA